MRGCNSVCFVVSYTAHTLRLLLRCLAACLFVALTKDARLPPFNHLAFAFMHTTKVPALVRCKKIIICDGVKVGTANKFRAGRVTGDAAEKYSGYVPLKNM